jgi:alkylated DNA nucleotide flippase Atl1
MGGSPFSTYGDGHAFIGLNRASRVIGRYIDTGKKYQDKYIISSIPLPKGGKGVR